MSEPRGKGYNQCPYAFSKTMAARCHLITHNGVRRRHLAQTQMSTGSGRCRFIAHHGVLFLDELPEFKRSTLESLRQPLEDRKVTISRAAGSVTFPTDVLLLAALNPCPCDYLGDPRRECRCSPREVETTATASPARCSTASTSTLRLRPWSSRN